VPESTLFWLEHSALGEFMRNSSLWVYPVVNLLHILGIAALFGGAAVIDLRLLGLWRNASLAAVSEAAVPVAAAGFGLAVPTGIALLVTKSTEYIGNPYLPIKFAAILVATVNVALLNFSPAWKSRRERELEPHERRRLAVFGGVSLAAWLTAVASGRLIAYW
jgi:hypothetical protein